MIEHSHLSSDMFVLYLHQNYLHMHSHVDDVVSVFKWIEEASKPLSYNMHCIWLLCRLELVSILVHRILSRDSGLTHRLYVHLIRTQHTFPSFLHYSLSFIPSPLFTLSPSLSLPHSFPLLTFTLFSPSHFLFLSIYLFLSHLPLPLSHLYADYTCVSTEDCI